MSRRLAGCQLLGGESVQEGPVASVIKTIVINEYGERIMSPTYEGGGSQSIYLKLYARYNIDQTMRACGTVTGKVKHCPKCQ